MKYDSLSWCEKKGVISFSATSDGTIGPDWISRLAKQGVRLTDSVRNVLFSDRFNPTSGITREIVVLKGELFSKEDRTFPKIYAEAGRRVLQELNAEHACLMREILTNEDMEEMGLHWIIFMHNPIEDLGGDLYLLKLIRAVGNRWLKTYCCNNRNITLGKDVGFAFILGQRSS